MADESIVLLSNQSVKMWEGFVSRVEEKQLNKCWQHRFYVQYVFFMVCTIFAQLNHLFTKWMPVINIHIPDCLHLKRAPDQYVWSVSANIVFEEILHSQIHWGSWGSSGLITLKDLNRINPHQIHNSQRLAFKSPGSWSKHLHTRVYIFLLSPILLYNCVWITECFFCQNSKFFCVCKKTKNIKTF